MHPCLSPAQDKGTEEKVAHPGRVEGVQDRTRSERILPEHVERIYGWYRDFTDVEGVARVVTLDEIAANDHNLNIPRYVEPKNEQEMLSVDEAMKRLRQSATMAFAAQEELIGILKREELLR